MAVFPQLVSRLGHENNIVAKALHTVIVKLVRAYPQQLMWTIVGITNMRNLPENVRRAQRARKVLEDVVSNPSGDPKIVQQFKGSKQADMGPNSRLLPYIDRSSSPSHPTNRYQYRRNHV